jgi:hypothetical protein
MNKKILFADYDNCLTNIANSVLKHFGAKQLHGSLPVLDAILAKNKYKNVVLVLIDGLGAKQMARYLAPDTFLQSHRVTNLTSVFPATTAAASTSIVSGLNPVEHGWLGWDVYIKDIDQTVSMFKNVIKDTDTPAADYDVARKFFNYQSAVELVRATGTAAYNISPYPLDSSDFIKFDVGDIDTLTAEIHKLCADDTSKYIYAYYDTLDRTMHDYGGNSTEAIEEANRINAKLEALIDGLNDTLVIITADHGHTEARHFDMISQYPEIADTLLRDISMDKRAANFFIKPGRAKDFEREFKKNFGDHYLLMPRAEVLSRKMFGPGTPNPRFDSELGDFIAIAVSDHSIVQDERANQHPSAHAGITTDEVQIPLIIVEKLAPSAHNMV